MSDCIRLDTTRRVLLGLRKPCAVIALITIRAATAGNTAFPQLCVSGMVANRVALNKKNVLPHEGGKG
jgi:hypothetical protein